MSSASDPTGGSSIGGLGSLRPVVPVLVGLALLAVAVAVRLVVSAPQEPSTPWAGVLVDPPRQRPAFELTTIDGAPFDFGARTGGRTTFLFFGYSNCPDVCPVQLSALTGALRSDPAVSGDVVFVTTDPARDTPERLREWLSSFDYPITALTGSDEQLRRAQEASGLAPSIAGTPRPDGSYEVGHAAQVLLITPDDQVHLVYPLGVRREDWLRDLRQLGANGWATSPR